MLCLLVYYWQDGEKGPEYKQLSEVPEATFLGPGFRTHIHVGAWLVSYWYPFQDFGRDPLPSSIVKTTCAWIPVLGKLPVRHPCASRAGLPHLLSQAHVSYIPPEPLAALESSWKPCKISTVISARADLSAVTLNLARSHEICSDIFPLARESWPFLRVRCPAMELLFLSLGAGTVLWPTDVLSQNFVF